MNETTCEEISNELDYYALDSFENVQALVRCLMRKLQCLMQRPQDWKRKQPYLMQMFQLWYLKLLRASRATVARAIVCNSVSLRNRSGLTRSVDQRPPQILGHYSKYNINEEAQKIVKKCVNMNLNNIFNDLSGS